MYNVRRITHLSDIMIYKFLQFLLFSYAYRVHNLFHMIFAYISFSFIYFFFRFSLSYLLSNHLIYTGFYLHFLPNFFQTFPINFFFLIFLHLSLTCFYISISSLHMFYNFTIFIIFL